MTSHRQAAVYGCLVATVHCPQRAAVVQYLNEQGYWNKEPHQQHSRPPAQVLPTQLIPDEKEGKVLRVRFIQKEGVKFFDPVYLFDEGSTISWIPCGRKLTCSFPGIKCAFKPLMRLLCSEIAPSFVHHVRCATSL
jgi:hypothetical protein